MFPVLLEMSQAKIWCIGGGSVAYQKAKPMVEEGAELTVIAPECEPKLKSLASEYIAREYMSGDIYLLPKPALVIVATDSQLVNTMVEEDATALGLWTLRCDTVANVMLPARVPVPGITVAVSTGVPALTSKLSITLASQLDARWAEAAKVLHQLRTDTNIRKQMSNFPQKHRRLHWKMATSAVLDGETDPVLLKKILTTELPHDNCTDENCAKNQ